MRRWLRKHWRAVAIAAGAAVNAVCPLVAGDHVRVCDVAAELLRALGVN